MLRELKAQELPVHFNLRCNQGEYKLTEAICNEQGDRYGCQPQMDFICVMNGKFRVKLDNVEFLLSGLLLSFSVKCQVADDEHISKLFEHLEDPAKHKYLRRTETYEDSDSDIEYSQHSFGSSNNSDDSFAGEGYRHAELSQISE